MTRTSPFFSSVMAAALLAGCLAPTGTGPKGASETELGGTGLTKVLPQRSGIDPAGVIAPGGGQIISRDGAGIISRDGAGIISRDGAGVIAAGGGQIVSRDGAGYRLAAAVEQVPVRKQLVYLMNAEGKLVVDAEGEPITAQTDEAGKFTFSGLSATRNLLLAVQLMDDRGRVTAVLPKGDALSRTVDLDVVSTLTTTYIRERYVKGQSDPAATLDKLDAATEAETRLKAAAALEKGQAPASLEPASVVAAVDALRQGDVTFDAQMETVKRLLVAAGQSDLGAGRLATETSLGGIGELLPEADGGLLLAASVDRRVWRINAAGRIETVAGIGTGKPAMFTTKPAKEAPLGMPYFITRDGQGTLLIVDMMGEWGGWRVSRLEPDGQLRALPELGDVRGVFAGPDGGFRTLVVDGGWKLKSVKGEQVQVLHAFEGEEVLRLLHAAYKFGSDAAGRIYFASGRLGDPEGHESGLGPSFDTPSHRVTRFDPANKAIETLAAVGSANVHGVSVDRAGNVFWQDTAGALKVRKPDGSEATLASALPGDFRLKLDGVALMPDGSAFVAQQGTHLYRVRDGKLAIAAGKPGAVDGQATDFALQAPAGLAFGPSGELLLADGGAHRVLRIGRDGATSVIAGNGQEGDAGDNGPAVQAQLRRPTLVAGDRNGAIYVGETSFSAGHRLRKIAADGTISTIYSADGELHDLAVASDGSVYLTEFFSTSETVRYVLIKRLEPGGGWTTIVPKEAGLANSELRTAIGPDGLSLLIWDSSPRLSNGLTVPYTVHTWRADEGLKLDAYGDIGLYTTPGADFVARADGLLYFTNATENTVVRYDPATRSRKVVAGAGSGFLDGAGVDDGLWQPTHVVFGADGDLYVTDSGHKQVKRIPAERL